MGTACLYEKICADVKGRISEGELQARDKIPSLKQFCEDYGVSHVTVLRAMRELVGENVIEARKGKGYFVKEESLHQQRRELSGTIACIVRPSRATTLYDNYFNDINQAIQRECMLSGFDTFYPKCNLLLANPPKSTPEPDNLRDLRDTVLALNPNADGVILDERVPDELIFPLRQKTNRPIVVVGRNTAAGVDAICPDNVGGARQAGEICMKMNYEHFIVCVNNNCYSPVSLLASDRTEAFIQTLRRGGVPSGNIACVNYNLDVNEVAFAAIRKLLGAGKTLVFSPTDEFARWLCDAFLEEGVTPGKDIGIMGFQGMGYSTMKHPHITTVDVQTSRIGRRAVEVLTGRIHGTLSEKPTNHVVPATFQMGETI